MRHTILDVVLALLMGTAAWCAGFSYATLAAERQKDTFNNQIIAAVAAAMPQEVKSGKVSRDSK